MELLFTQFKQTMEGACFGMEGDGIRYFVLDILNLGSLLVIQVETKFLLNRSIINPLLNI